MKTLANLAVVLVLLLAAPSWADDDHRCYGGHNCNDGDTLVNIDAPVDVDVDGAIIGGDSVRSLAVVAPGLGDVDIAQCLGSTSWTFLVGGKQKLVLNQVCMAEFYLKNGRYDLAAQALCNQPEILDEYKTEVACEIDHDFTPPPDEGEDKYNHDVHSRSADFEAAYAITQQQQEEEIEYMREEQATLVTQVNDLKAYIERPRPASVQQQAELFSEERMQSVLNAYRGEKEEGDD